MIICEIDYQYRDDFILSILFSIVQVSIFIHHEQSISFVMMGNTVTQRHKKYSHISEHSKSLIYGELCRISRGISFQLWMNLGLEKDVSLLSCLSYNCKALQKSENKWRQNPLYLFFLIPNTIYIMFGKNEVLRDDTSFLKAYFSFLQLRVPL